ncbi:putative Ankyrin repeat-containing protein [Quillaja saponaria]|uniref:Ankyrin repeat-containing protein n=1 Tax=Quillaja saponaria TaxID=32244 RepID=A0AAD7VIN6_QUISA|nr:putative Ankyrin repeat-containing protein [Quillaja saponaria]
MDPNLVVDSLYPSDIKQTLSDYALRSEWEAVIKLYVEESLSHTSDITLAKDTALHVAVTDGNYDVVEQLVGAITHFGLDNAKKALLIKNEQGNTPLHLAASVGSVQICRCIVEVDIGTSLLLDSRNKEGETPIFVAALNSHKDAFLFLHTKYPNERSDHCRRSKGGESILHCTIQREYFDLAFHIIHLYKELINQVDENGVTPLYVLASNPSVFRSGNHLQWWANIIYRCINVDPLKVDLTWKMGTIKDEKKNNFMENYRTCFGIFQILFFFFQVVTWGKLISTNDAVKDTENPVAVGGQEFQTPEYQDFPENYATCYQLLGFFATAFGLTSIRKIKGQNKWSLQIMEKLLHQNKMYSFTDDGSKPMASPTEDQGETNPYNVKNPQAIPGGYQGETNPYNFKNPQDIVKLEWFEGNNFKRWQKKLHFLLSELNVAYVLITPKPVATENETNTEIHTRMKWEQDDYCCKGRICNSMPDTLFDMYHEKATAKEVWDALEDTYSTGDQFKMSPLLEAAKNGVTEMVDRILYLFPMSIRETTADKNILHVAVENRQPRIFKILKEKKLLTKLIHTVDNKKNTVLHLAAMLSEHKPWQIPGAALQMQWEIKWYELVKSSVPRHFLFQKNINGKNPGEIFTDAHKELVKEGGEWLKSTSESCSVVAALIATVAFATSSTVPGGTQENTGRPNLEGQPAFNIFAVTSLVALCFSVTALIMFLSILTSRHQPKDFHKDLPWKLLVGLSSLFLSIASILIAFCAGHFFVLKDNTLRQAAFPLYAVTCLPVTFYAAAQFPLYFDLLKANFKKVPRPSIKIVDL